MVTRNTPHLVIVIFSDEVVKMKLERSLKPSSKMKFLLLCLDRYLVSMVSCNRYLPRGSKENVLSTTIPDR